MTWRYGLYGLPSMFAAAISLVVAIAAWRRRPSPGATPLVFLLISVMLWSVVTVLQLFWPDRLSMYRLMQVEQIGVVGVPVFWMMFALEYAGLGRWLTRRNLLLLAVVESAILLAVFTDTAYHGMWPQVSLNTTGAYPTLETTRGLWWWVNIAVNYPLIVAGTLAIGWCLLHSWALYQQQAGAVLLGVLIPWVTNILFVLKITPEQLNLMPLAFSVGGLCFLWGCYRYRMLDLVPVARDKVLESMTDAVIILDHADRVVDLNPPAERLVGQASVRVIGQTADQCLSPWPDLVARYRTVPEAKDEVVVGEGAGQVIYDLQLSLLRVRRGQPAGRLLVLRDITSRKQAEDEIRRLNTRLEDQVAERTRQLSAANERLQILSRRLVEVQEEERRRLALELHDELGQILNSVKMSLDMLSGLPEPVAALQFQRTQGLVGDLIHRVRELALNLRPSMLDDLGLVAALDSLCRRHAAQTGAQAILQQAGLEGRRFPPAIETAAYRIAQEGLTNASRHAQTAQIYVKLKADHQYLTLEVADAGVGFVPEEVLAARPSTGLSGMRERARLLGGELVVESAPGCGTRLVANLPIGVPIL